MRIDTFTAITLDNIFAPDDNQFFMNNSSEALLIFREEIRQTYDGILVGINTIIKDNPNLLNKNLTNYRIVIDFNQNLTFKEKIFQIHPNKTIVLIPKRFKNTQYTINLTSIGVNVVFLDEEKGIKSGLKSLEQFNIKNLLVEGGEKTISSFINLGIIQTLQLVIFPNIEINGSKLFKLLDKKINLRLMEVKAIGNKYIFGKYSID